MDNRDVTGQRGLFGVFVNVVLVLIGLLVMSIINYWLLLPDVDPRNNSILAMAIPTIAVSVPYLLVGRFSFVRALHCSHVCYREEDHAFYAQIYCVALLFMQPFSVLIVGAYPAAFAFRILTTENIIMSMINATVALTVLRRGYRLRRQIQVDEIARQLREQELARFAEEDRLRQEKLWRQQWDDEQRSRDERLSQIREWQNSFLFRLIEFAADLKDTPWDPWLRQHCTRVYEEFDTNKIDWSEVSGRMQRIDDHMAGFVARAKLVALFNEAEQVISSHFPREQFDVLLDVCVDAFQNQGREIGRQRSDALAASIYQKVKECEGEWRARHEAERAVHYSKVFKEA